MLCVPKVNGVENKESMWKHSPKSKLPCQVRLLLLPICVPSHNFFRNFFAKSFVVSIIIVTFAVSYLTESSRWAKAGWTYIHKGVTVRFGFDVSESRKFNCLSKTKQRERLMGCIIYVTLISSWHFCNELKGCTIYLHRRGAFSVARFGR